MRWKKSQNKYIVRICINIFTDGVDIQLIDFGFRAHFHRNVNVSVNVCLSPHVPCDRIFCAYCSVRLGPNRISGMETDG